MKYIKIVTIVGARPQFIKAATVSRAILEYNNSNPEKLIEELIVHTGQHYDANMSDVFFEEMDIPKPAYTLGIGGGNHGEMTGKQLEKIENILIKESPNYVLVYGDTNSTLAGALAAAKLHIPVVHIEAGLRSFNMRMPEEINRILTDQISSILFCPTQIAMDNLFHEGFESRKCKLINVGDVMYDAALYYTAKSKRPASLDIDEDFVLVTIHRADNTDNEERLKNIVNALNKINESVPIVCPVHPRTRKVIANLSENPKFDMIEPVSYFEMIWLINNCKMVITDSGGLQKEAYFFKKHCITIREQTEWVELVNSGNNRLVAADTDKIVKLFYSGIDSHPNGYLPFYGDGNAAGKIIKHILEYSK